KRTRPLGDLKKRLVDAPPRISFAKALRGGFGLIAEIKERSPSMGRMKPENVAAAPQVYKKSKVVKAISVLTNRSHFGRTMTMDKLRKIKIATEKPVLRKYFIFDKYQVVEARAFGADAVLLMANILDKDELAKLFETASELGM